MNCGLIAATTTPAVLAARTATNTIPIVFFVAADPVQLGLVTRFSRPGGNLTGKPAPRGGTSRRPSRACGPRARGTAMMRYREGRRVGAAAPVEQRSHVRLVARIDDDVGALA